MRKRAKVPARVWFEGDVWFEKILNYTTDQGTRRKYWFRAGAFYGDDYAEVEGETKEACLRALAPFFAAVNA